MLMVIFGAGASFDSDPNDPADGLSKAGPRIPMARDLFWSGYGPYAARFPACQGLLRRLRAAAPAVEAELERIRIEGRERTFLLRELEAVRYYLQALIEAAEKTWLERLTDHVTTYTLLLQEIEEWREDRSEDVAFVTFNYDRLLDRACRSVVPALRLRRVSDYGRGTTHLVFKLHGSTDWHEEVNLVAGEHLSNEGSALEYANALIDRTGSFQPSGRYVMDGESSDAPGRWGPLRPALAIPMTTKRGDDFSCPREHIESLAEVIPEVGDLILVGWRAEEQHFQQLWRNSVERRRRTLLRRLLVVDGSREAALGIASRVRESFGLSSGVVVGTSGQGFSASVQDGIFRQFLEAS